jgi:hypothetical protein
MNFVSLFVNRSPDKWQFFWPRDFHFNSFNPILINTITDLEDFAPVGGALVVDARLVHAQCHAVEEDDGHADPLEPRVVRISRLRKIFRQFFFTKF